MDGVLMFSQKSSNYMYAQTHTSIYHLQAHAYMYLKLRMNLESPTHLSLLSPLKSRIVASHIGDSAKVSGEFLLLTQQTANR